MIVGSDEWRAAVVAEAKTWLNTPYRHCSNIKDAGVDCLMLLIECYRAPRGPVEADFDPGPYSPQWFLHRSEEIFLEGVLKRAVRVEKPRPADVAMFRFGRNAAHGAIVIDETTVVHANFRSLRVELCEISMFGDRLEGFFSARPAS